MVERLCRFGPVGKYRCTASSRAALGLEACSVNPPGGVERVSKLKRFEPTGVWCLYVDAETLPMQFSRLVNERRFRQGLA